MTLRCTCILIAIFGSACSPYKIQNQYQPDVLIPDQFSIDVPTVTPPVHWWNAFKDEGLDEVVQEAFVNNFDLKIAWARLDQAMALATIQGAARLPEVNLNGRATRTRSDQRDTTLYTNRFNLGLGLTWELDLWKKIANRAEAAALTAEASRNDAEQTALLLSGTVVNLWFTIQQQEQLLDVLKQQIKSSRTQLELIELRYGQGIGNALQVFQQRLQLSQVEAEMPTARSLLQTSRNQLSTVLGKAPGQYDIIAPAILPQLPDFPTLPTPKELLELRPDLQASYRRVAAADLEVAAAIADMLPTLRISLEGSFSSPSLSRLFEDTIGSMAGSLLQPVFDGDRRGAEADRRRAVLQERLDSFSNQFLTALLEVEDAIDRERNQLELLDDILNQIKIANSTLAEARLRYANGQNEYLDVISAIQAQQQVQRRYVLVRKDVLSNRASLYVALGGAWLQDITPPTDTSAKNQHPLDVSF